MSEIRAALIIGASRGIGLAITETLLKTPGIQAVCATYRNPASATGLFELDDARLATFPAEVTDEKSLQQLSEDIRQSRIEPDLVIHCAGILHEPGLRPEKSLQQCHADTLQRLFAVNSIGPLLAAKAIIPLLPKQRRAHFAVLSAMVGSIEDNRLGGWYGYRASKAALNQLLRTLSIECRRTHPELCVTAIHPGTTDTGLSAPFQGNVEPGKLYTASQTAARIIEVVMAGKPGDSGRFVNWNGSRIPF